MRNSNFLRYEIKIYGRVQGVGFRFATVRVAQSLGVVGFVRNEEDGSVFIVAEGEKDKLEKLLSWCWQGPFLAKVENVEKKEAPPSGEFDDFSIKY